MSHPELQFDSLNSQNVRVIQAYADRAKVAKKTSEEFDGWLERIDRLEDVASDELTRLHGQLIAMGFLKFEISGRSVGLKYRISTRGKNALERAVAIAEREKLTAESGTDVPSEDESLAEAA